MKVPARSHPPVRFGVFEIDDDARELRKSGLRLHLQEQPFRILQRLLERPGQIVTHEELKEVLSPSAEYGDFDQMIRVAVWKLRNALSDNAQSPQYIETIPQRGYRFIGQIVARPNGEGEIHKESKGTRWGTGVLAVVAASFLLLTLIAFISYRVPTKSRREPVVESSKILVADFRSNMNDPVLTDALRQALVIDLRQSPFLNIIPAAKLKEILKEMGRKPDEPLNDETTREACIRCNGTVWVEGSLVNLGSRYELGVRAVNCATGEVVAQQQTELATKAEVLTALSKQGAGLRRDLGESLASIQKYSVPFFRGTTSSLEALQAFGLGQRKLNDGLDLEAVAHFKRAIELDPNFASAYARLGTAYRNLEQSGLAEEYTRKAFDLRSSVSPWERSSLERVFYDRVTGDYQKEIAACDAFKSSYPNDIGSYIMLGNIHSDLGEYERCVAEARVALKLYRIAITYMNLADCQIRNGNPEEAQKILKESSGAGIRAPLLDVLSYHTAFLRGDTAEMRRLIESNPNEPLLRLEEWRTETYYGRIRSGREFLRRAVSKAREDQLLETASLYVVRSAIREADFGNVREAHRLATQSLTVGKSKEVMIAAAIAYGKAGDSNRATVLADELTKNIRTIPCSIGLLCPR